ncbi:transposase [Streptomyces arboris]|uniref:Transposase n=1 Tax=Streptomyces arboris TaxID=2600619 RepID=A0A5N5ER94_9ACTN|nr:transposase [Streptomyces arboris]
MQTRNPRGDPDSGGSASAPPATRQPRRKTTRLRPRHTRARDTVERSIYRLEQWRGIATRYEKTVTTYLAGLHIAGIFLWSARSSERNGLTAGRGRGQCGGSAFWARWAARVRNSSADSSLRPSRSRQCASSWRAARVSGWSGPRPRPRASATCRYATRASAHRPSQPRATATSRRLSTVSGWSGPRVLSRIAHTSRASVTASSQ